MKKNFYNLNHEYIFMGDFECGHHQNISLKIGRSFYLLDIRKNALLTSIHFYKRVSKARETFSKYEGKAELVGLFVQNNAILERRFFENAKVIKACQDFLGKYDYVLHPW